MLKGKWKAVVESRLPDMELPGYLRRWNLGQNRFGGRDYLHHLIGPDEPTLHDHPWAFSSEVMSGGYTEVLAKGLPWEDGEPDLVCIERVAGSINMRKARQAHYISAVKPDTWTHVITRERVREWGFWVREWGAYRWIPFREFLANLSAQPKPIYRNGYEP